MPSFDFSFCFMRWIFFSFCTELVFPSFSVTKHFSPVSIFDSETHFSFYTSSNMTHIFRKITEIIRCFFFDCCLLNVTTQTERNEFIASCLMNNCQQNSRSNNKNNIKNQQFSLGKYDTPSRAHRHTLTHSHTHLAKRNEKHTKYT